MLRAYKYRLYPNS
ncbi:helix-turn-helix domain-containing protein, partial [Clostridioides sp. ZZV14-6153]|nr:helix-turn-helix domain-containing protein [Clostridioides sp. ZZV14-6153]